MDLVYLRDCLSAMQRRFSISTRYGGPEISEDKDPVRKYLIPDIEDCNTIPAYYEWRTLLRGHIEAYEAQPKALAELVSSEFSSELLEKPLYLDFLERRSGILEEARRFESELRDYLQLEGSRLALEESKNPLSFPTIKYRTGNEVRRLKLSRFISLTFNSKDL